MQLEQSNLAEEQPEDFFDMSMKKKKKKKKKGTFESGEEGNISLENEHQLPVESGESKETQGSDLACKNKEISSTDFDSLLLIGKKKKKKAVSKLTFDDEQSKDIPTYGAVFDNKEGKRTSEDSSDPWLDSDRDYTYVELLNRAKELLRLRNPDMDPGKSKPVVCPAPEVTRISTKRTSFVNFYRVCKALHRQPEHLHAFLTSELGSPASMEQTLIIKGRFNQKQIENVMRRYIKEYVTCHSCRSPNTILTKEDRIYNLSCETCQATCSVAAIHKTALVTKK
jgi:translation initiation factor 2 subunit 2